MSTMALGDVRPKLAAVLAPIAASDPPVQDFTDAVSGPCYQLAYGFPWLAPFGNAGCNWRCNVAVTVIAGRLEPGDNLTTLEDMTASALRRLQLDAQTWPVEGVGVPENIEYGGVAYLGARITLRPVVSIGGPDA
jgi:hypothetical protein